MEFWKKEDTYIEKEKRKKKGLRKKGGERERIERAKIIDNCAGIWE